MSRLPPEYEDGMEDEDGEEGQTSPRLADPVREAKMQVARAVARRRRSVIEALKD